MSVNKIRQILAESGPDSIPGRLEPKGPVQDLGGPVVTPATSTGHDPAKSIKSKQAALPQQGGAESEGGAPNPTKYKDEDDVRNSRGKELGERRELPSWLKARLMEEEIIEDEEVYEEELPEEEIDEEEEISEEEIDEADDDEDDEDDEDDDVNEEDDEDDDVNEEELTERARVGLSKSTAGYNRKMRRASKSGGDDSSKTKYYASKSNSRDGKYLSKMAKEDVDALFNGTNLSEQAQNQILTVFESVVSRRVNSIIEDIAEEFEEQLEAEVAEITDSLVEQVDHYLDNITETWLNENQVAVEQGIRTQLAESLLSEMKDVFTRHYIDIPENKIDIVDTLAERVETLEEELNQSMVANAELMEQVEEFVKSEIISEAVEGLVKTDADKIVRLSEGLEFVSEEDFADKIQTIKESYLGKQSTKKSGTSVSLQEENLVRNSDPNYHEQMADAVRAIFKN